MTSLTDEQAPCSRDCQNRHGRCHEECEAYLDWSRRRREMMDERIRAGDIQKGINNGIYRKWGKRKYYGKIY